MGGVCKKKVVIPKHFMLFLFNPLNKSLKSTLQFNLDCFILAKIMKIVSVSKYGSNCILICVPKINDHLMGLERHEGE